MPFGKRFAVDRVRDDRGGLERQRVSESALEAYVEKADGPCRSTNPFDNAPLRGQATRPLRPSADQILRKQGDVQTLRVNASSCDPDKKRVPVRTGDG